MTKKSLVLTVCFLCLVAAAGTYSTTLAGEGLVKYLDFEMQSQNTEIDLLKAMNIVHATETPGLYAWLGDREQIPQGLTNIESSEESAYEATKRFTLPFTFAAKMKRCLGEVHELRAADIAAMRQVIANTRTGSDAVVDQALKSFDAYAGSATQCQTMMYLHEHHRDGKSAPAANSEPAPSSSSTGETAGAPDQASSPSTSVTAATPPQATSESGIERDYNTMSNKIRETKSTADITPADIAALANTLSHPTTAADWQYLAQLDAGYTDPANSCDTSDCAIAESIVEQAEQRIKSAGLQPPSSVTVHFKLGQ